MDFDLDAGLFDEPPGFRPPTPPPFNPKLECYTLEDGQELSLRLVSSSPLWGHVLYPSAVCLAKYLEANPELVKGRRILELGAGAGLPALVAAQLGAEHVVVTDFPEVDLINNLAYNVKINGLQRNCRAQGFVWGSSTRSLTAESPEESQSTAFDTILLADLVFNHSQHEALLNSCEQLLTTHDPAEQSTPPTVLCFYAHHRPTAELIKKDESFLDKAKQRGWIVDGLVENPDAGLAFPEDQGDVAIRATVKGWALRRATLPTS